VLDYICANISNLLTVTTVYCDLPVPYQIDIQTPATPVLLGMISFHYYLLTFMLAIGFAVFYLLGYILITYTNSGKNDKSILKFSHSNILEVVWTIIPGIVLIFLAVPSFNLLYSLDDIIDPSITLKVIGHQWYWTYEYTDLLAESYFLVKFDSYLVPEETLEFNSNAIRANRRLIAPPKSPYRLIATDLDPMLPVKTHVRLLVTSADVLHSWAVPSFGIKIDACPGRLSQVSLFVSRYGSFVGQCSEICGVNHGFMPIVLGVFNWPYFLDYLSCNSEFYKL
jgi:cytochrome c oxidase subunit 2